jgi:hypothetical protein
MSAARNMNGITQGILEIEQSPWRMIGLIVVGILLTALSASIAFNLVPDSHLSSYDELGGCAGVVFFGLCTAIAAWRLVSISGPVVTITPEGIRDTRVAAELIPWRAVTRISTWQYRGQKVLVLANRSDGRNAPDPHTDCPVVTRTEPRARGGWTLHHSGGTEYRLRRPVAGLQPIRPASIASPSLATVFAAQSCTAQLHMACESWKVIPTGTRRRRAEGEVISRVGGTK